MGMVFIDWETQKKLRIINIAVMILGMGFVNPLLNFRAIVKQISKNPANKRKIQEMFIKPLLNEAREG